VSTGLPADMEPLASGIERARVLFAAGSDSLDQSALMVAATVAAKLDTLVGAARRNRYDVALVIVGRADATGSERDNLTLSRRRALAVRQHLISLGMAPARLAFDATGSNDPLPADSPADRARLNRSASFVVRAQPAASSNGAERVP
jgi:outer membrane protein OmpA-like peptidoglycan-associated protein